MAKRWMENTAGGPRVIGGKLLQPGEGTWVEDVPPGTGAAQIPVTASIPARRPRLRAGDVAIHLNQPQMPRLAMIGTSVIEDELYRQSTGFVNNGDGTFDVSFAATVRPNWGEGDVIKVTQGPAALSTRRAEILTINGAGTLVKVRPDTAFSLGVLNEPGTTPFFYAAYSRQSNSIIHNAQSQCGARFVVAVDASLGGGATEDLLAIIKRDLVDRADEFDAVVQELGIINGVYARGNSFAVERAYTKEYIDTVAEIGKPFIVMGCPPRSTGGAWTSDKLNIITDLHAWAEPYVQSLGGIFINPYKASYHRPYLNVASADAAPDLVEATTDGVHPNSGGAPILAAPLARAIEKLFPAADVLPASVKDVRIGLVNTNPFMTGTGGAKTGGSGATVTGTVADGCDVVVQGGTGGADTVVACSIVPRTEALHGDAIGNAQRLLITTGATATHIIEFRFGGDMKASFTHGDSLQGVGASDTSNSDTPGSGIPVALRNVTMVLNAQTATTLNNYIDSHGQGSNQVNRGPARQVLVTRVGKVRSPAATHGALAAVRATVWIMVGPNAKVCIDIGRVGCKKILPST